MKLFAYGTLMSGEQNSLFLEEAEFLGAASMENAQILNVIGGPFPYPGLMPGTGTVKGELYKVDESMLRRMDVLEGHPNLYVRTKVVLSDGTEAISYLMKAAKLFENPVIESGDWRTISKTVPTKEDK